VAPSAHRVASLPATDDAGLVPVAIAFVTFGMFWGSWAVAVADVRRTFSLNDAQLGLLLAVAIGVAGLTGGFVGHRAEYWGTRRMLFASLLVWSFLLVAAGLARPWPVFAAVFVACEVAAGCVDTAMNAASARRLDGRPGDLVRFHAFFNSGAVGGALVAAVLLHAGVSWRFLWPVLAVVVAALAFWTRAHVSPTTPPAGGRHVAAVAGSAVPTAPVPLAAEADRTSGSGARLGQLARLRTDGLLLLLLVFALAEVTEGGVDTWGVLFLRTRLAAGILLGAGAYAIGQSMAAASRGAGGRFLGRLSPRRALIVGGLVAGSGLLLVALSPAVGVAAVGLALGAAGASLFWPLVMSDVVQRASRTTSAVGAFTAAGYVGWVASAPVVGWVSDAWGPSKGLLVLAAMALLVALISFVRRDRSPRPTGSE